MPSRDFNRRLAALVVAVALLALPAAVSQASQPVDSPQGGSAWSVVWSNLSDLFASWFGFAEPTDTQRVIGESDLGSMLDPDGVVAPDPTGPATTTTYSEPTTGGELGSMLDPDG
jgi:hypothetical protein